MTRDAIELQQRAVEALVQRLLYGQTKLTFRAPTGSGKTRMMASMMERLLTQRDDVVFLVSTLSKGDLATQNYSQFERLSSDGTFPHLRPHLISSEVGGEERLHVPTGHNVYVLARDLYKRGGRLMQGAMEAFLLELKEQQNKHIVLVRDECHQATTNLDTLAPIFFSQTVNMSATPKLRRGQVPDVEIGDDEAVAASLIKRVEVGDMGDDVEVALRKLEAIKGDYLNRLGVNPCLIIQLSNKDKFLQEWQQIESLLCKPEHQHLKWMLIVDKDKDCRSNDKLERLPVARWKAYAKGNHSAVDVIIFKMVISEGWDIPRACMLYQVRDTQSRQLDEQVLGRVRRNPRLVDFERLDPHAQQLATTAWVWGLVPQTVQRSQHVRLAVDAQEGLKVQTTILRPLHTRPDFDLKGYMDDQRDRLSHKSIFDLYATLQKAGPDVQAMCYGYATDAAKWHHFCEHISGIKHACDNYSSDYGKSMMRAEKEVSLPLHSSYTDNCHYQNIGDWVWRRDGGGDRYSFDSEAEREWATILKDLSAKAIATSGHQTLNDAGQCYLWGKNYIPGSEVRFEYYLDGVHASYPDFVLKDKHGRIHLFEVKSVNRSKGTDVDSAEYERKAQELKKCYRQCSILTRHVFYLPVQDGENWQIVRYDGGEEAVMTKEMFVRSMLK